MPMPRAFVFVLGIALVACQSATESVGDSATVANHDVLAVNVGSGQTGTVNRPLLVPLTVFVTASDGTPRQGVALDWVITSGGGSIAVRDQATTAEGKSTAIWTLGPSVGSQSVSVQEHVASTPG